MALDTFAVPKGLNLDDLFFRGEWRRFFNGIKGGSLFLLRFHCILSPPFMMAIYDDNIVI